MSTSEYWEIDDLDMLADDLDTSLSGLGGTGSAPFDMSEALSVLQVLKANNENEKSSYHKKIDTSPSFHKSSSPITNSSSVVPFSVRKTTSKVVKKPCRKTSFETKCEQTDGSSCNASPEPSIEDTSLLRVASAPLLSQSLYKSPFCTSLLSKEEDNSSDFQYVLAAPTALGSKLSDESLTYLNQGQSYEVRLKKQNGILELKGKLLKSVMKVGFHERRLQFREKVEIINWQSQRPWDRILDIDIALSYGIFDVKTDVKDVNYCEFAWDPTREASVFIKINCISTEFTSKRKGGEKGVAFRILIETFPEDLPKKIHCASCLVKVFKAKGADRKHKTDKERIEKLPQSEQLDMKPSYQFTVFTQCASQEGHSNNDISPSESGKNSSFGSDRCLKLDWPGTSATENLPRDNMLSQNHRALLLKCKEEVKEAEPVIQEIGPETSASQVTQWLIHNRFTKLLSHFSSFNGYDLMCLSREDVIEICGVPDGIRLHNALHSKAIRPKLMLYLSSEGQTFHAICLHVLTLEELKKQLCEVCHLREQNFQDVFLVGPSDILVHITDKLVSNMKHESIYIFEIARVEDNENFCVILQPYCCNQVLPTPSICCTNTKENS